MIYLRTVRFEHILDQAGVPKWRQNSPLLATMPVKAVWTIATPVRDRSVDLVDSRFFRSIRDECDDVGKRASLLVMLTGLYHALGHEDYQPVIKHTAGLNVKPAHIFKYRGKSEKVWELKYQNKDRLYFFSYSSTVSDPCNLLIPLSFLHKKDQTTPDTIKDQCEREMKPLLDPNPQITILKE